MKRMTLIVAAVAAGGLSLLSGIASEHKPASRPESSELHEFGVYDPKQIKWKKGPASLPDGAETAVLEGDPSKPGPFVFRVKVPDGFTIPPHTHPKAERVTVIAGQFHIAMGEKLDKSHGEAMPAGSFGYWPAGMKHYAWVTGDTIVQFHGMGPWVINYLNPADDPRNKRKP